MKHSALYLWLLASGLIISWIGFEAGTDGIGPPGCRVCRFVLLGVGVISILMGVVGFVNPGRVQGQVGGVRSPAE